MSHRPTKYNLEGRSGRVSKIQFSPGGRLFFASDPLSLDLEALERNRKQKESQTLRTLWTLSTIGSGREI